MRRIHRLATGTATALRVVAAPILVLALAAPAAAAEGGLSLVPDLVIFPVLLTLFVVLIFPLDRLLFRPLFRVLEQREERIAGARARAERLVREADEVIGRYRAQVREVREEAERERKQQVGEATASSSETTAAARREAESQVDRARREVTAALEDARSGLRASAEQIARDAAERVLGRALS